ncbi:M20/M25/M40 family metallo-hydrolase [Staphylococcus hominis]|uniref:Succinyl-diaminopimelate desuccinylase n=1 Tax=Staphylococcus hominis TaxID=1290 RepID=A0A974QMI4_STAHO|nr:M20/M25/M40 family metallo-hydrolase [Staphylococcus hominis]MDT4035920.1 M20/M25/M40 family metallo-hydrolase [Staphylococcus hominis]PTK29594.1 succinyl-diaminopimelate desuccinylase [Staphylococcus hominis]RIO58419.1 M20 family peptidase [Staphylococcus hominis]
MSKTLKLLEKLITYDSSTKEGANDTIDYCKEWLNKHNLETEIVMNSGYKMLICTIGQGDKTLVLNGHVDVVSGKVGQFEPKIKNGKIYGRGSADMKAGVAAFMVAMTELQNVPLNDTKVQLQLVTDEEIGGNNCTAYLTDQGYLGDFVICAEPTQLGIGFQAKGILQFDIQLSGKSAHGSRPWEGENAIEKAFQFYNQILNLPFAKSSTDIYESPSINLAKINGGDVYNKVPDSCEISFDIRYLPTQNKDDILEQIKSITDGEITVNLTGPAVLNETTNPYIQQLITTIKEHTILEEVPLFGQHGFADTRYFSRYNVPAIEFGPSGESWHGDNECAIIDSLDIYKDIIVSYTKHF